MWLSNQPCTNSLLLPKDATGLTSVGALSSMLLSLSRMAKTGAYYAVAIGREKGVFRSWDQCKKQVDKFKGARYKKFDSQEEALLFIQSNEQKEHWQSPCPTTSAPMSRKRSATSALDQNGIVTNGLRMTKRRPLVNHLTSRGLHFVSDKSNTCIPKEEMEADKSLKSLTPASPLNKDSKGFVEVYTDGACECNGSESALAGIGVWFRHDHEFNVAAPVTFDHRQTNNVAEILASKEAICIARTHGIEKLRIITDSQFLINCVTKWMSGWKGRGWKTAANKPVANKKELELLDQALNDKPSIEVEWKHVNGHVGIEGNEMADQLARLGAKKH